MNKKGKINFEEITDADISAVCQKIAQDPENWILFLGDEVSFENRKDTENCTWTEREQAVLQILQNAMGERDGSLNIEQAYSQIQDQDFAALEDALFGDAWDGAAFQEEYRKRMRKRRKLFAQNMSKAFQINIDFSNHKIVRQKELQRANLTWFLKAFPGIVLTTCQDETIEAFLEYEDSLPVEENVCTPYSLTTSPKWERRLEVLCQGAEEKKSFRIRNDNRILVKLRGSCRDYKRMLLSQRDFEVYYSSNYMELEESRQPYTVRLLKTLFEKKNLFFVGVKTNANQEQGLYLDLPEQICGILKDSESPDTKRYLCRKTDMDAVAEELEKQCRSAEKTHAENEKSANTVKDAEGSNTTFSCEHDMKEILWLFQNQYHRRRFEHIPEEEKRILKRKILRRLSVWMEEDIYLLAVAANNLADFYDLEVCIENGRPNSGSDWKQEEMKPVLQKIIRERCDRKSLELYRLLQKYGSGFPSAFFRLFADDETKLQEMKRAAIRLVNIGICEKENYRKNVHRRMEYADMLMLSAGTNQNPGKKRFQETLKEINSRIMNYYFYMPQKETMDFLTEHIESGETYRFETLCRNLISVFENKSDGYNHYRSLMGTEMDKVLEQIMKLKDRGWNWMPKLIYYLFRECRLIPVAYNPDFSKSLVKGIDALPIEQFINTMLKEQEQLLQKKEGEEKRNIQCSRMMLYQSLAIIKSQFEDKNIQTLALNMCQEADKIYEEFQNAGIMPEEIFEQKVQTCLLTARIHGRLSTLEEIERCRNRQKNCAGQRQHLKEMEKCLNQANHLIEERKHKYGYRNDELKAQSAHDWGEYYFKMSQFFWENRKYGEKAAESRKKRQRKYSRPSYLEGISNEDRFYKQALEKYDDSLKLYEQYPYQYELYIADVLRNKADLLCQKQKSGGLEENGGKQGQEHYELLYEAYKMYRRNGALYGIADVLQSMGNAEDYSVFDIGKEMGKRSSICFYNAAEALYKYLGDRWNWYVAENFRNGAILSREADTCNRRIKKHQ